MIGENIKQGRFCKIMRIAEGVTYIGVNDKDIDLFEGQYRVDGISYNSYLITDEKTAVLDTADKRRTTEWLEALRGALAGKKPDYLVISHMEPDHSASIGAFAQSYPEAKLVGNAKTFQMLSQYFTFALPEEKKVVVTEGEELSLGAHTLVFYTAPMVHWPEVMAAYEKSERLLFSADGFGKFGALPEDAEGRPVPVYDFDPQKDWDDEARRYYLNIVGKYGAQTQALLKKAAGLDIAAICPLHGPVLTKELAHFLEKYRAWSAYEPEKKGVLIAYSTVYGNTEQAARLLSEALTARGVENTVTDLARDDTAQALALAFMYDRLVLATTTYDGGIFPAAEEFILHLKAKTYRNRTVGFIENGTWAPMAAKLMRAQFEGMKEIAFAEPVVTLKSAVKDDTREAIEALAEALAKHGA